jgi:hypothetical protein
MIPAFENAAQFKNWTLAAALSAATALTGVQEAKAAYVAPNSLEDYILSNTGGNLSELDELKAINAIGSSRVSYQAYVIELNRFHEAPDRARFQQVDMFGSRQLYEMMVYGGESFYDNSFAGVFDRFDAAMKKTGRTSLFDTMPENFRASIVPFLNNAVTYNAQARAAGYIKPEQWPEVLNLFASRIRAGDKNAMTTLAHVAQVAEPKVQRRIERFMQNRYNNARNPAVKDAYGLTAGYYNSLQGRDVIALQNSNLYTPKRAETLGRAELAGTDGVHRQLVVFPNNDRDAGFSFASLVQTYQSSVHYQIENYGTFVKISSVSGHPVEIFANHPSAHPNDIFYAVGGQDFGNYSDVEFDAVIDRSSYDFRDNIDAFTSPSNAFIFAGKNGDTYNTRILLQNAPDAHVISTPRTGNPVNPDSLLFSITDEFRNTGRVNWTVQNDFLRVMGQDSAFILPSENRIQTITDTEKSMLETRMLGMRRPVPNPAREF